jgi:hypothetical protein
MHVHFSQIRQAVANGDAVRAGGRSVWWSCGCSATPQSNRVYG